MVVHQFSTEHCLELFYGDGEREIEKRKTNSQQKRVLSSQYAVAENCVSPAVKKDKWPFESNKYCKSGTPILQTSGVASAVYHKKTSSEIFPEKFLNDIIFP